MFIEPTITWVPSGFSGYIWLDTKIVLKKKKKKSNLFYCEIQNDSCLKIDEFEIILQSFKIAY